MCLFTTGALLVAGAQEAQPQAAAPVRYPAENLAEDAYRAPLKVDAARG